MLMREIGKTGVMASAVGFGTWAVGGGIIWGERDDDLAVRAIHEALDAGINLIDTAPVYGFGHSEEVVGRALKGRRDKVIVTTKCGLTWEGDQGSFFYSREGYTVLKNLSRAEVIRGCEESLRRLQTDYIDVFMTHWQSIPPFVTPISETMDALLQLKKEGKIRAIGASNVSVDQLKEYMSLGEVALVQEKYSMLDRRIEEEIMPFCEESGISIQAYSPLEQGILTGRFTMDTVLSENDVRNRSDHYKPENRQRIIGMLEGWRPLCEKYRCSMSSLVIAWTAAQSERFIVLCGSRKPEHARDNVQGGNIALDWEDLEKMRGDLLKI